MTAPIDTGKSLNQLAYEYAAIRASESPAPVDGTTPVVPDVSASAPTYNLEDYFSRRLGAAGTDKLTSLREARAAKIGRLEQFRAQLAGQSEQQAINDKADQKSWVGRLGLDPNGFAGQTVNEIASLTSGASRQVVGAIASLPTTLRSIADESKTSEAEVTAYNNYLKGEATPEDMDMLNRKTTHATMANSRGDYYNRPKPNGPTVLELLESGQSDRQTSRKINNFFDISSIVHMGNRRELDSALASGFQKSWDQVKEGWNGGNKLDEKSANGAMVSLDVDTNKWIVHGNVPMDSFKSFNEFLPYIRKNNYGTFDSDKEAHDFVSNSRENPARPEDKDVVNRAMKITKGIAGLLINAGDASITHPAAVSEYVSENVPQLAVGALKGVGSAALLTSNAGYAADFYQQGIENYQKANKGQMPSQEDRKMIAVWAASLAVSEHLGDHVVMGAIKAPGSVNTVLKGLTGVGEGASNMATDAAVKEATKQGFKQSLLRTAGAVAEGGSGEALTEGYQGFAENKAAGKGDATPFEIYQQAVIGGVSGAHLSGGGHVLAEVTKSTPEQQAERTATVEQSKAFNEAATNNDPSSYLDTQHPEYNPSKGIGVMFAHNQLDTTTHEVKQKNLEQAAEVMSKLDEQYSSLVDQRKNADPKEQVQLTSQIKQLQRHINDGEKLVDQMVIQVNPIPSEEHINEQVKQANQPVIQEDSSTVEQSTQAADNIINLSMQNIENLSPKQADTLASNESNSLSSDQRDYLRAFSTARQSDNQLTNMGKVSQTIYYGDDKGNLGIAQYRQRIGSAIAAGNKENAQRALGLLSSFASDHTTKAEVAAKAMAQNGLGAQIIKTDAGWQVATEKYSDKELRKNGGLTLNSGRLVRDMQIEAKALSNAQVEAEAAVNLHFQDKGVESNSSAKTVEPSPNNLPKKDVEEGTRPESKLSEPSKTETPTPSKKDIHIGKSFTDEGSARSYLTTQRLLSTHTVKQTGRSKFDIVSKEQSVPNAGKLKREQALAQEAKLNEQLAKINAKNQPEEATNRSLSDLEASPTAEENNQTNQESGLSVMSEKTPTNEKHDYQERHLLADYFIQTLGKTTGSTRPLVEIPGFLKSLASDTSNALFFLKDKTLTEQQDTMLRAFSKMATDWIPNIIKNFAPVSNPLYRYRDVSQFLLNKQGQADENVHTAIAYAGFSWLAENAGRSLFNTDEEVNIILGKEETALISMEAEALLRNAGTRENVVINALGQRVAQALGLTARADAPRNLAPQLESTLGTHVLNLLLDQGILERNVISGEDMAILMEGNTSTNEQAQFKFIKVKTETDGMMTQKAQDVLEAMKGTQGVLDKLFGAEVGLKDPASAKIPFVQKTTRNTDQAVPSKEAEIMVHENAQENHVRMDMWHLIGQLHPEIALAIAGMESINEDTTHAVNKASIQAKNDGLRREYDRMMEFFNVLQKEDRLEDPLFFDHSVWKQQRVGISNNTVNPQSSKMHRRMLSRPTWITTISFNDAEAMDNFKLRVAEGLGVKTDKQDNQKSLQDASSAINAPDIKAAIKVLRKAMTEGGITSSEQQTLLTGVQTGGEAMHTLDSLVAVAHYMEALDTGKDSFTTQLMGEVDGVTNGPMLSHLLMGAATDVNSLFDLLNRGGFYQQGSTHTQYNQWRAASGNQDLYEITSSHMVDAIKQMAIPQAQAAAITSFTGTLVKDDKVTKEGRNIIKTPLTAMVFGSSVSSAVDSMADKFIESVYGKMEDVAAGKHDIAQLIRDLGTLEVTFKTDISVKELMSTPLSTNQIGTLKNIFKDTIGKAVETTMKQDFATFIESRRTFNTSAQLAYDLYNAAYTGMREQRIAELIKSGDIAVNKTTGAPLHDLTNKQEEQLRKEVQDILPLMHTAFSQQSGELNAGLMASKSSRKLAKRSQTDNKKGIKLTLNQHIENTYTSEVQQVNGKLNTTGYIRSETAPGVAMAPMSIHSTDAFISHVAAFLSEVLNIHDAHGAGLNNIHEAAKNLNQATWQAMLTYSPAKQMADTLSRVVTGVAGLLESDKLTEQSKSMLNDVMNQYAKKLDTDPHSVLDIQVKAARDLAYHADDMKLQALEQMQAVDQYALQGGNYEVTDADRKAAKVARTQLNSDISETENKALAMLASLASKKNVNVVKAELKEAPVKNKTQFTPIQEKVMGSAWGDLGAPSIVSDQHLVDTFNKEPVMSGKRAIAVLKEALSQNKENRTNAFATQLITMLEKTIPADMTVQMVTPATPGSQVIEKGADKSRGWYVAKGDTSVIYLLSPDFKYSGLTPETMLHEMIHGALARTVQSELDAKTKDAAYTSPALELVNELENLRTLASQFMKDNKLTKFAPATTNVHELISWGMSNLDFQRQVLNQVSMKSVTTSNKFVTGMKRFIDTLTGLLFKGSTKSVQAQAENGMAVMIANTSGLFYAAAQTKSKADLVLNQINNGQGAPHVFNTTEIFDALGQMNTSTQVSPGFNIQLKTLLQGIVDTLHGPFGTFKEQMEQNAPTSPVEAYAQALQSGKAPFASKSLAAGFRISEQEAFVLEQVEATMRAALYSNEGHTTAAYQELSKLYQEVSTKLKVEDFHKGKWAQATPTEKAEAQQLHDFLFKLDQNSDQKSDYLARFAALGLAHERVADLLKFATDVKTDRQLAGLSFTEKLHAIYDMVLSWLNGQFTHTFEGQQADAKLEQLVSTLIDIEAKKRMKLGQVNNKTVEYMEDIFRNASETARDKIEQFGRSPFFKENTNAFLKAGGALASAIAGDRVGLIMDGIQEIRDKHFRQRNSLVAGIINEIRGSKADNLVAHKMLRLSKHIEGQRKDIITNTTKFTLESFDKGGEYLSQEHKAAISQVVLRTDATSLMNGYSLQDTMRLITNDKFRTSEIARLTNQFIGVQHFGSYFIKAANMLGYYKATGRVVGANLMFNAENIARLYGTQYAGRISDAQVAKVTPTIDTLITLYALNYVDSKHTPLIQEVMAKEQARTDGNGIEMVLKLHSQLQQQAKDRLFASGDPLFMKGYVPEVYNPYLELRAATEEEGESLVSQGFAEGAELQADPADTNKASKRLYLLRDGGLQSYLTGIFSYTGRKAKGSQAISGGMNLLSSVGQQNNQTMNDIANNKAASIRDMFRVDPGFDPRKIGDTHLAPVLNPSGDVVNYRYMMAESTKDNILERNNSFDQLIGILAGSIFDKEMTVEQNERAVQALKDQYDLEFAERNHSYVRVGDNSTDPEMREIWRLLPENTKQSVRKIWGTNNMMVRVDLLDINFGYRKLSISDTFTKDAEQRNAVERVLFEMGTFFFGDKARLRFKQGEDIWQAFVREAKDTMVVKSGVTLMGNISSNLTELMWFGVPIADILRHHRVAMKGTLAYRQDSEKLERINLQLSTGYLPNSNMQDLQRQKVILEDSLARNPVRGLIDAGLMPTIVEDVAADDDMYSFKGRFTRKVDEFVSELNPHVVNTVKTLMIAHDTPLYKALSYGTQLSDFVARYTLYMHMTERQRNPMEKEAAVQLVSDAFINYDVPSHRLLQYANDTGLIYFSKYYLRIQKIITHLYRENPGRALMLLTAGHFFDQVPTLMDSAAIHRMGNPFSTGALKYVTTLDELGTVNALMTPFK